MTCHPTADAVGGVNANPAKIPASDSTFLDFWIAFATGQGTVAYGTGSFTGRRGSAHRRHHRPRHQHPAQVALTPSVCWQDSTLNNSKAAPEGGLAEFRAAYSKRPYTLSFGTNGSGISWPIAAPRTTIT